MLLIERAISYIEQYINGYSDKIQGANVEEIDHLEQVVGRTLPDIYRQFLIKMGHDMGGVLVYNSNFDIDTVLDFYKTSDWFPPDEYYLIGVEEDDPYFDIYLETSRDSEPGVVRFPSEGGEFSDIYECNFGSVADSFQQLLCGKAFWNYHKIKFPVEGFYAHLKKQPGGLTKINEIAEKLGFERQWYSGKHVSYWFREDAALAARKFERYALGVTVRTIDEKTQKNIGEILIDNLDVVYSP